MPGKGEELRNLTPGKFRHLEGNFALQNKEIQNKLWEIQLFLLEILPIFPGKLILFPGL